MSTAATIKHHIDALAAGDLDEVMADYSEDSVFINSGKPLQGLADIRKVFAGAVSNGGFKVEMGNEVYHGEVGYITWTVPGIISLGTDTFVVRDGVIVMQTSAVAMASG